MLINNGALGIFCAWFMTRIEKAIKNNTEVLVLVKDRLKRGK